MVYLKLERIIKMSVDKKPLQEIDREILKRKREIKEYAQKRIEYLNTQIKKIEKELKETSKSKVNI